MLSEEELWIRVKHHVQQRVSPDKYWPKTSAVLTNVAYKRKTTELQIQVPLHVYKLFKRVSEPIKTGSQIDFFLVISTFSHLKTAPKKKTNNTNNDNNKNIKS